MQTSKTMIKIMAPIREVLGSTLDQSSTKAMLSSLRNSVGKPLSQTLIVWPLVFEYLPEEDLGKTSRLTDREEVMLHTLQLYAIYQQGSELSVWLENRTKYQNFGHVAATLREVDQTAAIDRRFNALITSSTYDEFIYHLRQIIRLVKSKKKESVPIDFCRLAQDLLNFKRGYRENTRLQWAKAYYSYNK